MTGRRSTRERNADGPTEPLPQPRPPGGRRASPRARGRRVPRLRQRVRGARRGRAAGRRPGGRGRQPPPVPHPRGCGGGRGRAGRVPAAGHRDPPLRRDPRRADRPHRSRQADLLRDEPPPRRRGAAGTGGEPRRAAHQDRGQPAAPVQPRQHRRPRASDRPRPVQPRPRHVGQVPRRDGSGCAAEVGGLRPLRPRRGRPTHTNQRGRPRRSDRTGRGAATRRSTPPSR